MYSHFYRLIQNKTWCVISSTLITARISSVVSKNVNLTQSNLTFRCLNHFFVI